MLFENEINRVYIAVDMEKVIPYMCQINSKSINGIPVLQLVIPLYNVWIKGCKQYLTVQTNDVAITQINRRAFMHQAADLVIAEKLIRITKIEEKCVVNNLFVTGGFNKTPLSSVNAVYTGEQLQLFGKYFLF